MSATRRMTDLKRRSPQVRKVPIFGSSWALLQNAAVRGYGCCISSFNVSVRWTTAYGLCRNLDPTGRSSSRNRNRPEVAMMLIDGQRVKIRWASWSPLMEPGISTSVKTVRISSRFSSIEIASIPVPASTTSKSASSMIATAVNRSKISSSTTSTTGRRHTRCCMIGFT